MKLIQYEILQHFYLVYDRTGLLLVLPNRTEPIKIAQFLEFLIMSYENTISKFETRLNSIQDVTI